MNNVYDLKEKNSQLIILPKIEAVIVASIIVSLICFSAFLIYSKSLAVLEQEIKLGLTSNVSAAATTIDGNLHKKFTKETGRDDPEYIYAIIPLEKIRQASTNIRYLYTTILVQDKVYFILNPSPQNDNDGDGKADLPPALMEQYHDPAPELLQALKEQKKMVTDTYSDKWGTFISAYAPFYDRDGNFVGTLGMDLELSDFYQRLLPVRIAFEKTAVIVIFIGLLIGLLTWFTRKHSLTLFASNKEINLQLSCFNEKLTAVNNESQCILQKVAEDLPSLRRMDETAQKNLTSWIQSVLHYLASKREVDLHMHNFDLWQFSEMIRLCGKRREIKVAVDLDPNLPERLFGDPELLANSLCCLLLFLSRSTNNKTFTVSLTLSEEEINTIRMLLCLKTVSDNKFKPKFWANLEPDFSVAIDAEEEDFYLFAALASLRKFDVATYRFDNNSLCGFSIELQFDKYRESE